MYPITKESVRIMIESILENAARTSSNEKKVRGAWTIYSEYKRRLEHYVGYFAAYPFFVSRVDYDAAIGRLQYALKIGKLVHNGSELCTAKRTLRRKRRMVA